MLDRQKLIDCAMGRIPADLCITNIYLVNVLTGEVYPADVYVYDKHIVHVETKNLGVDINAKEIIDGKEQYLIPGLIDSHIHIESSMLTPRNFARGVVNHGTTTVVTDPHEIANVYGKEAVYYMHEASEDLPMRQLIDIPSCVPSVPGLENAGAVITPDDVDELAKLERVVGLAEVMDYIGVINNDERMVEMIKRAKQNGLYIQGHAPFMTGRELSAYALSGSRTCHESRTTQEFSEKLRIGMWVDVRESSIALNAREAFLGTQGMKVLDNFSVCTDDREADDILNKGHLNLTVNKLIASGMDPILAIKGATYNNARQINRDDLGAIAPGFIADMQLVPSLAQLKPSKVFFEGKLVSENGALVEPISEKKFEIETRNSMVMETPTLEMFEYKTPIQNGTVKVNVVHYANTGTIMTDAVVEELPVVNGKLDISHDTDLKYIISINRHGKGTIGYGVIRNFGTKVGAIASTVSHDSHNLIIIYDKAENALLTAEKLLETGGGMAAAANGELLGVLPLKVGGLMSEHPAEVVAEHAGNMKNVLENELGLTGTHNPLLRIATCALIVIPFCKMSDLGLVDVINKKLMPLYPEYPEV